MRGLGQGDETQFLSPRAKDRRYPVESQQPSRKDDFVAGDKDAPRKIAFRALSAVNVFAQNSPYRLPCAEKPATG